MRIIQLTFPWYNDCDHPMWQFVGYSKDSQQDIYLCAKCRTRYVREVKYANS